MLLGRVAERAAIDKLLAGARDRHSGSLVLTGDPGIGKSTLLDYARHQARDQGLEVLTAQGYESESQIPFAGLADLLRPVVSRRTVLPAPQISALEGALSLGPPIAGQRFSVCAATIGLLAAAAEESPVLVTVDDMHWLDASSREAIVFVARRLQAEGIALLIASRSTTSLEAYASGVPQLRLDALDRADADHLIDSLAPGTPADVRREIYDDAAGNPLGIEELCDQLARSPGAARTPGMPADSRLARALGGRLAELPEPTRTALLLVAASGGARTGVVMAAAERCGLGLADVAPAEEAGLLVIDGERIEFRHPLVRSVLYGSASTHARVSAHATLADVLADEPGVAADDARAWHLAVSRVPPDDETSRLLEASGRRARRCGGYLEAARAFEQAARFAPPETRSAAVLRAAWTWQVAGGTRQALALLETALPITTDPRLRAALLHMRAYLGMWRQRPEDGLANMLTAAKDVEELDPGRAAIMYADAGIACFMLGRIGRTLPLARRADELSSAAQSDPVQPSRSSPPRRAASGGPDAAALVSSVALAAALTLNGQRAEAAARLAAVRDRLGAVDPLVRAQEYGHAAYTLILLEDYDQAAHWLDRLTTRVRAAGAVGLLPQALAIASELYFRLGRWGEALAAGEESVTLAEQTRAARLYGQHFVARLDGVQGRVDDCTRRIQKITSVSRRFGVEIMALYTGHTLGLVALAAGDLDDAIRHLEGVRALPVAAQVRDQALVPWAYDLVEAYARAGRPADARALLDSVAPDRDDATHRWQHAVAARCRGLLAPREAMLATFETALDRHERSQMPFERARTLLCLGERLRRERQRAAARDHLHRAVDVFDQLGAVVWAGRARSELAATGETLTRGRGAAAHLTPQELQVAIVVGHGATNQEAAAALFLSPKTIEYHLSNIYRKTQVRSRSGLSVLASAAS